jgi:hypothetical protein
MHAMIKRIRAEEGFVMVIAVFISAIVLLLGAGIVAASVTTSSHATHEYGRSDALAVANAGLEVALHRLSSQGEETSAQEKKCFTTEFVAETEKGLCPASATETVAGGASFKYYVSPVLSEAGNECTGLWVSSSALLDRTITQRCVTAVGIAEDKVQARVQERVANVRGGLFSVPGVFSLSEISVNNPLVYNGELGARIKVTFNNAVTANPKISVKYGTSVSGENKCPSGCTFTKLSAEELASSRYSLPEVSAAPFEAAQTSNNNASIAMTSGSINANRELNVNNATTIKIPSGTYDLCFIGLNNASTIEYTPPVTIYLDSVNRSGSTCPNNASSGTINFNNPINWVDTATTKAASDLRLIAWGKPKETNNSAPVIKLNNNVTGPWYAEVFAPYSFVEVNNKIVLDGAIQAGDIKFNNEVEMVGLGGSDEWQTGTFFYPTAYHQCSPTYTESKPAIGCY